jgi:hypothetical protein
MVFLFYPTNAVRGMALVRYFGLFIGSAASDTREEGQVSEAPARARPPQVVRAKRTTLYSPGPYLTNMPLTLRGSGKPSEQPARE